METRNLKISKETANRWYNGSDTELKQLALQTFPELAEKELPKSWEELGDVSGYWVNGFDKTEKVTQLDVKTRLHTNQVFATREQAKASIALAQLSQLMKVYNDGWVADWTNKLQGKYTIELVKDELYKDRLINSNKFLAFKDSETRDLFLENFRDLILIAKPLLG